MIDIARAIMVGLCCSGCRVALVGVHGSLFVAPAADSGKSSPPFRAACFRAYCGTPPTYKCALAPPDPGVLEKTMLFFLHRIKAQALHRFRLQNAIFKAHRIII